MRSIRNLILGVVVAMLLSTGVYAGTDLNEVGALLVYPTILAARADEIGHEERGGGMVNLETFVTITNAGPDDVVAHVAYINGRHWISTDDDNGSGYPDPQTGYPDPQYCYECDFEIPLTGNDTETLVISEKHGQTHITAEDLDLDMSCPWKYGMLVVSLEDEDGNTISDNVLLGEEVVVNYARGAAFSIPAIPFQGTANDGNREFKFDDAEYSAMPRVIAADYLAPDSNQRDDDVWLSLFTLNFERQFPPNVDCSVIGFDADEHPFSSSFQFGCWTLTDLWDISPEFYYPNLGLFQEGRRDKNDTHGWLQLNCRVDVNPAAADGFEADGGVHGAIIQDVADGSYLPAGSSGGRTGATDFGGHVFWGRLLYQSVTTGDNVTLILEEANGGGMLNP